MLLYEKVGCIGMKNPRINLHTDRKKALWCVALYFGIFSMLSIVFTISINKDLMQLRTLMHSDYEYSAIMNKATNQDAYYQFDAGIYFALSTQDSRSLNVDILMQIIEGEYTDKIWWNAEKLDKYEVAISQNIARDNGLQIGDTLYSKHIVDGTVHEYVIVEILAEISSIRVSDKMEYNDGVIIIGFDEQYVDNITHHVLAFSDKSVDELGTEYADMPENILYRTNEMITIIRNITPYALLFSLLFFMNMVGFVVLLTQDISCNYRRMIVIGYERQRLNISYWRFVLEKGLFALLISCITLVMVFGISGIKPIHSIPLLLITFIELIAFVWTSTIVNRRLWRR